MMAIPALISALSFISFEAICLIENVRTGPIHADDAYFANVSKSLAMGEGYGSTIQAGKPVYEFVPFDHRPAMGPIPIVLAAGLIATFGNLPWVPGLANILLHSSMLLLAFAILYRDRPERAALFSSLFLLAIISTGSRHFELWYSLLGEGTVVSILVLLGALLYRRDGPDSWPFDPWMQVSIGLLCGAAVSTKLLALVPVAPVLLFLGPLSGQPLQERALVTLRLGAGFLAPLVAFEAARFASLGPADYLESTRTWIAFVGVHSQNTTATAGVVDQLSFRSADLYANFGLPGWLLIVFAVVGVWTLFRSGRVLTAKVLGTSSALCWTWWFLLSPGRPRYAYYAIALTYLSVGLAALAAIAADQTRAVRLPGVFALAVMGGIIVMGILKVGFFPAEIAAHRLETKPELADTIAAVRQLEERGTDRPLFTQWWATAAATEYLLPGSGHFTTLQDPRFEETDDALVVLSRGFVAKKDPVLVDLLDHRCSDRFFESPRVLIALCGRH